MELKPKPRRHSLWPKEHGAYAQLALPLLTALALTTPTLAAVCFALTFVLAFIAHEPLLVILGMRGPRASRESGPRARRMLAACAAFITLSATAGWVLAGSNARISVCVPLALGVAVGGVIVMRIERTLGGEVLVASALSATSLPVALASGAPLRDSVTLALVWAIGFAAATLCVRGLAARAKTESHARRAWRITTPAVVLALAFAAHTVGWLPLAAPLALTPMCGAALAIAIARPDPKRLHAVGWAIAAASTSAGALLIILLRR